MPYPRAGGYRGDAAVLPVDRARGFARGCTRAGGGAGALGGVTTGGLGAVGSDGTAPDGVATTPTEVPRGPVALPRPDDRDRAFRGGLGGLDSCAESGRARAVATAITRRP